MTLDKQDTLAWEKANSAHLRLAASMECPRTGLSSGDFIQLLNSVS